MKLINFIVVYVILFTFLGCKSKTQSNIEEKIKVFQNKEFLLPYAHDHISKKMKIVTYINGDCSVCINDLLNWKERILEDSCLIDYYFYCYTQCRSALMYIDSVYIKMNYPLIYDGDKLYLKLNNLPSDEKMLQTFLLDKDNKVILIGNPLYNENLSALYRREIKNRSNN